MVTESAIRFSGRPTLGSSLCGAIIVLVGQNLLQTKTASSQHGVVYFVLIFDQNAKNKYL